MLLDIGFKFYAVPSIATWVQGHGLRNFMFKFLVKVFRSLYLLNLLMGLDVTMPVVIYWSEELCCTIPTHLGDHKVKVIKILCLSFWLKSF